MPSNNLTSIKKLSVNLINNKKKKIKNKKNKKKTKIIIGLDFAVIYQVFLPNTNNLGIVV